MCGALTVPSNSTYASLPSSTASVKKSRRTRSPHWAGHIIRTTYICPLATGNWKCKLHVLWYYTYLSDYKQYLVSRDRDLEPTELIWKDWKVDLKARQHSTPVISTLKREVCSNATVPRLMLASECLLWYSAFPMEAANFGVSRFQPSGADGCSAVGIGCVITVRPFHNVYCHIRCPSSLHQN